METNEKFYGKLVSTSPVVNHEAYDKYAEVLHNKIKDTDVYNIGVIAPYGAGKSSLIKTYQDKYPKEKTITISLANFNATDKDMAPMMFMRQMLKISNVLLKKVFYNSFFSM